MKNVLEYLEYNAAVNADKIAASDYDVSVTYSELSERAKQIGSFLLRFGAKNRQFLFYGEKCRFAFGNARSCIQRKFLFCC